MSREEPKLKFHEKLMNKKKKAPQRPSIVSNYSLVSLSDINEKSLEVWRGLPEEIRQDPSLASFKKKHERIHGKMLHHFVILLLELRNKFLSKHNYVLKIKVTNAVKLN